MSAPAESLTQPATPPPPRLLQHAVSPAQREAARRNGARSRGPQTAAGKAHSSGNARRHGLYARLHLFNTDETQALRAEIRNLFESMNPRGPLAVALVWQLALASFQLRRAFGLDRDPCDTATVVRQVVAIGGFESRSSRRLYDALTLLENLDNQAAERTAPKNKSGKRTPELIEDKENAPARHSGGADRQVRGLEGALWARPASSLPARLAISDAQVRSDIHGLLRRRTHSQFQPRAPPLKPREFIRFC